jgi:hypothetical protein
MRRECGERVEAAEAVLQRVLDTPEQCRILGRRERLCRAVGTSRATQYSRACRLQRGQQPQQALLRTGSDIRRRCDIVARRISVCGRALQKRVALQQPLHAPALQDSARHGFA